MRWKSRKCLRTIPQLLKRGILFLIRQCFVSEIHPPGAANRRCDCDGYRADTLGVELGRPVPLLYQTSDLYAVYRPSTQPSTRVALNLA